MLEGFNLGQEDVINITELCTGNMPAITNGQFDIHVDICDCCCSVTLMACKQKSNTINSYAFGTVQTQHLIERYFWESFYELMNDALCDLLTEIEVNPKRPIPDPNKKTILANAVELQIRLC